MTHRIFFAFCFASVMFLSSCGTYVPRVEEFWEAQSTDEVRLPTVSAGGVLEYKIKDKVYCDIIDAVIFSKKLIPDGWAAQITLDIQVDETSTLNPGASLITPMHSAVTNFEGQYLGPSSPLTSAQTFGPVVSSQSFTLGLGGTLSSQATREDKFNAYWSLDRLKQANKCGDRDHSGSSFLLASELGISQWLRDQLMANRLIPSSTMPKDVDSSFKQDSVSLHVRFVVITSGNITPSWKLVRVATNTGGSPLAGVNRTRTHDLLVTFGSAFKPGTINRAATSHAAQETGIAVTNGNRTIIGQ